MIITVQLKNKSQNQPFDDIVLQISYFTKSDAGAFTPKTDPYSPSTDGEVSAVFGDDLVLEREVFFVVLLKGTNILTQVSILGKKLNESIPVEIQFDYNPLVLAEPSPELPEPRPLFVFGRLLDKNGKAKMEDIQIIIEATRDGEDTSEAIAAVQTEAGGYFFIEYPEGTFSSASALIGLSIVENPLPIRLEDVVADAEDIHHVFPRRLLLVVETVAEGSATTSSGEVTIEECGCQVLDMHGTKRVLEEYSFYSLVRTTEPEILGFVLEEEDDISLEDVLHLHPVRISEILDSIIQLPAFSNFATASRLSFSGSPLIPVADPAANEVSDLSRALKGIKINRGILNSFLSREKMITKDNIVDLIDLNEALRFRKNITPAPPNRSVAWF
jgi:hypothetical protein